jgi:hypothetical protein
MAVTVEVDARVVDELVRRGFLDPPGEVYDRAQITLALEMMLRTWAAYA